MTIFCMNDFMCAMDCAGNLPCSGLVSRGGKSVSNTVGGTLSCATNTQRVAHGYEEGIMPRVGPLLMMMMIMMMSRI